MKAEMYFELKSKVIEAGYAHEIDWQQNLKECENNFDFAGEAVWVILNSGMKEQIARKISERIWEAIKDGRDISTVFNHKGKVAAIKYVLENSGKLFCGYVESEDKITFLQTIPYIGKITCWHLAKNLGWDCYKPDRHIMRIAKEHGINDNELFDNLNEETGDKVCVIDIVLWRAANLGLV